MGEHAHIGMAVTTGIVLALILFSAGLSYWIVQPFKPHLNSDWFPPKPKSSRQNCCHRH